MYNTVDGLIGQKGIPLGKKVTIKPRNGENFQGKISSVNRQQHTALIIEKDTGITRSVSLSTDALPGWPS